jgi:hypothetical protein
MTIHPVFAIRSVNPKHPDLATVTWMRWFPPDPECPEDDCPPATHFAAYVRAGRGFSLIVGIGESEDEARSAGLATVAATQARQDGVKARLDKAEASFAARGL